VYRTFRVYRERGNGGLVLGRSGELVFLLLLDFLEGLIVSELDPLQAEREHETDAGKNGTGDRENTLYGYSGADQQRELRG
jgi:hypothetical protein